MIKLFTIFFLILSFDLSAQVIKGQVLIFGSEEPLADASVYFDGMYKGGASDENGNFQLELSGSDKKPIIISAIGYHSTSIADYKSEEFLKIYLQPKSYTLDPVVVTYDGMTREEKEAVFKREFLGVSSNSRQCEILNMDDINLVYSKKTQAVKAFADVPILLQNKALGFKITYFLDQFNVSQGTVFFSGNYYFEPDTSLKKGDLHRVERKRKLAYLGSRMHFIRALYNDKLDEEGFALINFSNRKDDFSGLVVDSENGKKIFMRSRIAVIYKRDKTMTFLNKNKDFTFIDKTGFYDPTGITWTGSMADQRIGDLLPFEYGMN